jgi:putative restriction endonuclease
VRTAWYRRTVAPLERRRWTRDELLLVLHLYTRIPFGQQHARNPQVIDLALALDRTPSSVAMKLNNFTSLDPHETARGVKGLKGASLLDTEVWAEFESRHAEVAPETEALWQARVEQRTPDRSGSGGAAAEGRRTETTAERSVRLGQDYFRRVVLANFGGRCAITGIAHSALLNASHIVAWADHEEHRLDPANGIALNRLHDAAFDQHLITFDERHRLVVGRRVRDAFGRDESERFFACEGRRLEAPARHALAEALLARHRETFRRQNA